MEASWDSYTRSLLSFGDRHRIMATKLYILKSTLLNNKLPLLSDVNLAKIRFKVDRKFPVLSDLSQASGFSTLSGSATEILSTFEPIVRVLREVCVYMNGLLAVLKNPLILSSDLKFDRILLHAWIECFSAYIKNFLILEKIPEAYPSVVLYFAARTAVGSLKQANAGASDFAWLKNFTANQRRYLIDEFSPMLNLFRAVIGEVKSTVSYTMECRNLREYFDCTSAELELNGRSVGEMDESCSGFELMHSHAYAEFVVLATFACPAMIFDEEFIAFLQKILDQSFIIVLFRDLIFNVHLELELTYASFPSQQDAVKVPKDMKISQILKIMSRQSVSKAGLNQMRHRRLLMNFIQDTINLVKVIPGIVGPKARQLLSACVLLKQKICSYFQHYPPVNCRKDSKANFVSDHYSANDISACLKVLNDAIALVAASLEGVRQFYRQFVTDVDTTVFHRFANSTSYPTLQSQFSTVTQALHSLKASTTLGIDTVANGDHSQHVSIVKSLSHLMHSMSHIAKEEFGQMPADSGILFNLLDHATMMDITASSLAYMMDPYEVGWFRGAILASFQQALCREISPLAYFSPFQSILLNIHPSCIEETMDLGNNCVIFANTLVEQFLEAIVKLVKQLWSRSLHLESQYKSTELIKRLDTMFQSMIDAGATLVTASFGLLPGYESEVWAEEQMKDFVVAQRSLASLLKVLRNKPTLRIFNREYNLLELVRMRVEAFFRLQCQSLFLHHGEMVRFSTAALKFEVGLKVLHHVYVLLDLNAQDVLRDLKRSEIFGMKSIPNETEDREGAYGREDMSEPGDDTYAALGLPVALDFEVDAGTMLGQVCRWFEDLVQRISLQGSNILWVPAQQSFINLQRVKDMKMINRFSSPGSTFLQSSTGEPSIEQVLNHEELVTLVQVIGLYGVRIVESRLLVIISTKIREIADFITRNAALYDVLESDYCFSISAAQAIERLETLTTALKIVGIAVAIRQMLLSATASVARQSDPNLFQSLELMHQSMNHELADVTGINSRIGLYSLTHSLGIIEEHDFAMFESLINMNITIEELKALHRLPLAAGAIFGNRIWDKLQFSASYAAFENNEHLIPLALAKLFSFTVNLSEHMKQKIPLPTVPQAEHDEIIALSLDTTNPLVSVTHKQWLRTKFFQEYIRYGAQCILTRRERENPTNLPQVPFSAYFYQLYQYAVSSSPVLSMNHLQEYVSYDLIHHGLLDMSLGKWVAADAIQAFKPVVKADDAAAALLSANQDPDNDNALEDADRLGSF